MKFKVTKKNNSISNNQKEAEMKSFFNSERLKMPSQIKNGNNLLSSLVLSAGKLNENITSDLTSYTVDVEDNVSKLNVEVIPNLYAKSNVYQIQKNLDYGRNVLNFKLLSTYGFSKSRLYTLTVNKKFKLTLNKNSSYKLGDGYLYTENDQNSSQILSNLSNINRISKVSCNGENLVLKDNYSKIISQNKILNFSTNYTINQKNFVLPPDTTVENLKNSVKLNGLSLKVVDKNNTEITSGKINTENKIQFYFNNNLVDTYAIKNLNLTFDNLSIDNNNLIIKDIVIGTKYSEIISKISTDGQIKIKHNTQEISTSSIATTGDEIVISFGDVEYKYKISVLGDLNKDGILNEKDMNELSKLILNPNYDFSNDKELFYSADVTKDGRILINDLYKLSFS